MTHAHMHTNTESQTKLACDWNAVNTSVDEIRRDCSSLSNSFTGSVVIRSISDSFIFYLHHRSTTDKNLTFYRNRVKLSDKVPAQRSVSVQPIICVSSLDAGRV
jgi:hypothetical protein